MLARMFSGDMVPGHYDSKGRFFIDRNGELFGIVMSFLRAEPLNIPSDPVKRQALAQEAKFFQARKRKLAGCRTYRRLKYHIVCHEKTNECGFSARRSPWHHGCLLDVVLLHALQLDDLESRVGMGCDNLQDMCLQNVSYLTCETGYHLLIESARAKVGQEKVGKMCAELVILLFEPDGAGSVLSARAHDLDG